jgi:hypothetical protein
MAIGSAVADLKERADLTKLHISAPRRHERPSVSAIDQPSQQSGLIMDEKRARFMIKSSASRFALPVTHFT